MAGPFQSILILLTLTAVLFLGGCAGRDLVLSDEGFEALSRNDFATARSKLQEALAVNPDNPYALLNLGVVYQQTGHPQRARQMYERVIALRPDARAQSSNVSAFSGRPLSEIAEANLRLLDQGETRAILAVPQAVPSPAPAAEQEAPPPASSQDQALKEPVPEPEEALYTVREKGTLLEIAGRPDVYGDPLKWPILFRLNTMKFSSPEDVLKKPIPRGAPLKLLRRDQATIRAGRMGERLWVVNAASVETLEQSVPPAIKLMESGHHVYLVKTQIAGEEWIRVRTGFYQDILEAMKACEAIRPLMEPFAEPCVARIDREEFERHAGY